MAPILEKVLSLFLLLKNMPVKVANSPMRSYL